MRTANSTPTEQVAWDILADSAPRLMRHRHHKTSAPKPTAKQRARNLTRKARYSGKSKSNLTDREAQALVRTEAARRELKHRDRLVEEES